VNFTREPIIETVISSREGMKLLVRNSKGKGLEDYYVDAVEIVSFGQSSFFRSLERQKVFLVPVADYEILELKEARISLKSDSADRAFRAPGGKESSSGRLPREEALEERDLLQGASSPPEFSERKRDRRRPRRRSRADHPPSAPAEAGSLGEEVSAPVDEVKAPSFISKLFPPPPTLIKETLSRYKPPEEFKEEPISDREETPPVPEGTEPDEEG